MPIQSAFSCRSRRTLDKIAALVVLWLPLLATTARAAEPIDYQCDIRPLLADRCFACHGPGGQDRKSDLRLDDGQQAHAAGVLAAGKPDESELLARIQAADPAERMPPPKSGKTLSAREIGLLRRWIAEGAKYSAHWAYLPPRATPVPATQFPALNDVDHYLFAALEARKLAPSPAADRRTLARRLAFDLTGLPPAPADVDAFVADDTESAYERYVDQLLGSDAYAERMAIYWLDLVRFADTVGYHGDQEHHASPYRDYVIDAFAQNLPFDQFTREQLAGDLLPEPTVDQRIATCYNRLLQTSHEGGVQPKEYLTIYAADRVRNLSAVWLGATIGCAQCHDHKYDPYTQRDFYALAAFFADIDEERHLRGDGGDTLPTKRAPEIAVHTRRERDQLAQLDMRLAQLPASAPNAPTSPERAKLEQQRTQLQQRQRKVMVTVALETPRVTRLLPRGNWLDESGPIVTPAVPEFLGRVSAEPRATRLDLANWLTDVERGAGGLTARVFVNRVWYLFFGAGLVRSLDDFGAQGEAPDHPELLDALTLDFVQHSWDVKRLVKLLVTSRAYRQSSAGSSELLERDPDNRWFARQGSWRLPAESVRDTALAASGLLVREVGGPSVRPYQPTGYYRHLNFPKREYSPQLDSNQWRRGLYVHWQRQFLHPMLKAFDAPSREECTAQRPRSNTPLAALALLNDPTFVEAARAMAQRALAEDHASDVARLDTLLRWTISRSANELERRELLAFLQRERAAYQAAPGRATELTNVGVAPRPANIEAVELAAWTGVCRAILNLRETMQRE